KELSEMEGPEQKMQKKEEETECFVQTLQNLAHIMDAAEKKHIQDEPSEISLAPRRRCKSDAFIETFMKMSAVQCVLLFQAEFQRLALGFKCDMFTLEKRLRLEERSRDLAEENVRREVSIALKCLELFTRSDENACSNTRIFLFVSILFLTLTKTATLSGRQENRIGKAVEVMIQHVENLRRTYTKEHAELLELREAHMQSERSFGSQTQKGFGASNSPLSFCPRRR
uniref:Lymphoid-restricted membrane protein n=1 Tax=Poecilia reticulata TaxID=8081 RepID=A0A3P9PCD9_POERE